ncbi:PREDICTED: protein PHLOEM PROTEIN 2-LIKE A10-like [Ipomoea nil]|uniref:protein PHLOEM PROTEIN 2-LIKE A10-like n=1 Tax=Ipomoea nil TaxID=35883 RepID=UPI00090111C5|nr:PREDICTED: protein PHLOEM PROTEIN 2-LIKE A10-like [Ipomoea nil]
MDLGTVNKGLSYTRRNKKWVLALGILGLTSYGAYRAYHSPGMVKKRERLMKLIGSLASLADIVSNSTDAIAVLSKDFKDFIESDSDQVPTSLRQISKIAKSDEVSESLVKITAAITTGILQGYPHKTGDSGCIDRVLDKLFTDGGSGFASVVVGSFAKNLAMAVFSDNLSSEPPRWVNNVLRDEKCRELIGDCVRLFVSSAVTVYLEKTMNINTYDQIFAGLTNPNHETRVRDMLVAVCHGGVETFVRTSHQVLTTANPRDEDEDDKKNKKNVLVGKMCSSALSVPGNRRFLLDLTGKVTFETMKSFQEFMIERFSQNLSRRVDAVQDKSAEALEYVRWKSSAAITACLSLCLHIVDSPWLLVPP